MCDGEGLRMTVLLMFALGVVGSLHCLQMCGPIVLAYSLPLDRSQAVRAHLQYNAGRILTYTALGAAAGAAGHLITVLSGFAAAARVIAGIGMIVAAVLWLAPVRTGSLVNIQAAAGRRLRAPGGKFRLGLMLGFLPCGLIYAALLKAVDAGSAVGGAATMFGFGLGTSAALLSVGLVSSFTPILRGRWSTRAAAVCIMATGILLVWRGLTVPVCHG
jgi:sulfite exporter TauE/SafE